MPAPDDAFDTPPPLTFDATAPGHRYRIGAVNVTRDAVVDFAARWDPQPFHLTDEGAAANPLFGRLAASGWHTVLLMQLEIDRFMRGTGLIGLAGGGVDQISWLKPVFPPDRLTVFLTFTAARPSRSHPELGILTMRGEAHDGEGSHVATLSITGLFDRRSKPASTERAE